MNSQSSLVACTKVRICGLALLAIAIGARGATPPHKSFPSAAAACQSLFESAKSNDAEAIAGILGAKSELASSGDESQDQADRDLFVQKFQEMHRLRREVDGSLVLYLGAENWPFPVPLVQSDGAWHFDTDTGLKEVRFRRIGENEEMAIAACREFVAAEKPGATTGASNEIDEFPVSLAAKATGGSQDADPLLFHGYFFRVLPKPQAAKTGAAFLVAYPAEYRSSGVMTFVVGKNDVLYEKDLGSRTPSVARGMKAFQRDATWRPADD